MKPEPRPGFFTPALLPRTAGLAAAMLALLSPVPLRCLETPPYLRENFGTFFHPAPQDPKLDGLDRAPAFAVMLKSLRDNKIEPSNLRNERLERFNLPTEQAALAFLRETVGGDNAGNPQADAVFRHFASPAGRRELNTALASPRIKIKR